MNDLKRNTGIASSLYFFHLTLMHLALVYYFSNIISLQIDVYKAENKQQKVMKFESSSQRTHYIYITNI